VKIDTIRVSATNVTVLFGVQNAPKGAPIGAETELPKTKGVETFCSIAAAPGRAEGKWEETDKISRVNVRTKSGTIGF
jgi:hypothetical protein